MDRTDLSIDEWLEHAIEEHMDAILYLNKIKKEIKVRAKFKNTN